MSLELDQDAESAILMSPTVFRIRKALGDQYKRQLDALFQASLESTDPKVRGIATAAVALRESLSLLKPKDSSG